VDFLSVEKAPSFTWALRVQMQSREPLEFRSNREITSSRAAAAFNSPLAWFLFVIEELRRELSPITYGAAFIAARLSATETSSRF
jgi:hypothetical protein